MILLMAKKQTTTIISQPFIFWFWFQDGMPQGWKKHNSYH
jgi:hypothetical protein